MKTILIIALTILSFGTFAQSVTMFLYDGDSGYFITKSGKKINFRDAFCNAPEHKNGRCKKEQPFANQSTDYAKSLIDGKICNINRLGVDIYGRTLIRIKTPQNVWFHRDMIAHGWAWSYKNQGNNKWLSYRLQMIAKQNGSGIWVDSTAINPSEWLKIHKTVN